jgi:dihydroorotate dehydrogenase
MNNNEFNSVKKNVKQKTGVDIDKMKQAADNGNLDDFINKNLSSYATKQLKDILTNKEATEKLLSTPQAKELMKKLMEGK